MPHGTVNQSQKDLQARSETVWDRLRAKPGGVRVKIRLTLLNSPGNVNQRDLMRRDVGSPAKPRETSTISMAWQKYGVGAIDRDKAEVIRRRFLSGICPKNRDCLPWVEVL